MSDVAYAAMIAQRERDHQQNAREWELHPRFGAFPSPELLLGPTSRSADATNTVRDFCRIRDWAKRNGLLNVDFFDHVSPNNEIESPTFNSLVQTGIVSLNDATRNTLNGSACEVCFFYYAGHGTDPSLVAISSLHGDPIIRSSNPQYSDAVAGVDDCLGVRNIRALKGGEMCLHSCGFCDLRGLIRSWVAGLLATSINDNGTKSNKHFVAVIDSCYSKKFVDDLRNLPCGPWSRNNCSITIQSSSDEIAYGELFTPAFEAVQDRQRRDRLVLSYNNLNTDERRDLQRNQWPRPSIATTCQHIQRQINDAELLYVETPSQGGTTITLFKNNLFYVHCARFIIDDLTLRQARALTTIEKGDFMKQENFTVLDFKLKPFWYNGSNNFMGLFMVENPFKSGCVVCVHAHFSDNSLFVGRLNLVEHARPGVGLWNEIDAIRCSYAEIGAHDYWNWEAVPHYSGSTLISPHLITEICNASRMLKACHDFVKNCVCSSCQSRRKLAIVQRAVYSIVFAAILSWAFGHSVTLSMLLFLWFIFAIMSYFAILALIDFYGPRRCSFLGVYNLWHQTCYWNANRHDLSHVGYFRHQRTHDFQEYWRTHCTS